MLDTCRKTLRCTIWSAQGGRAPRTGLYCAELQASAPLLAPWSSRCITTTMSTTLLAESTRPHEFLSSKPKIPTEAGLNCPARSTQVIPHRKVRTGYLPFWKSHLTSMRPASRPQRQCGLRLVGRAGRWRMMRVLRIGK
jgi:hypothetical protein